MNDEKKINTIWNRNFILILTANFMVTSAFNMINPTLPIYSKSMGITEDMVGFLIGIATIASMIIRPIAGRAADKRSKKNILLFALIIIIASAISYNFTFGVTSLMVVRIVQGIGIGVYTTVCSVLVIDSVPQGRMSEGIGIFGLGSVFAMAIGPSIGLGLTEGKEYHSLFYSSAGLCMIAFLLTNLINLVKHKSNNITEEASNWFLSLFEKTAIPYTIIIFFIGLTYNAIISFIPLYAAVRHVEHIGVFFTVYSLTLLLSRPLSGKVADKKGFAYVVYPGLTFITLSMICLYFTESLLMFLCVAVLFGLGFGCSQPTLQAMAVKHVPPSRRGAASSTFFIGVDIGIGLGATVSGILVKFFGYSNMYLLFAIPAALSIFIFFVSNLILKKSAVETITDKISRTGV